MSITRVTTSSSPDIRRPCFLTGEESRSSSTSASFLLIRDLTSPKGMFPSLMFSRGAFGRTPHENTCQTYVLYVILI